jgi:hypothetical protein
VLLHVRLWQTSVVYSRALGSRARLKVSNNEDTTTRRIDFGKLTQVAGLAAGDAWLAADALNRR